MESYLFYIGKAALAAGAFYIAYLALFQNRKQFVFNRIYLPVSLALSFLHRSAGNRYKQFCISESEGCCCNRNVF